MGMGQIELIWPIIRQKLGVKGCTRVRHKPLFAPRQDKNFRKRRKIFEQAQDVANFWGKRDVLEFGASHCWLRGHITPTFYYTTPEPICQ